MSSAQRRDRLGILAGLGCLLLLAGSLAVGGYVARSDSGLSTKTNSSPADPPARPRPRAWRFIVVHHSASPRGNAAVFDEEHKARGWRELGYHFVIGNGDGSGDGQIEIGPRWAEQSAGAHCRTPTGQFNEYGIGICLVGNFETDRPTPAQLASLRTLIRKLCGEYGIRPADILGHREAFIRECGPANATLCPGRLLDMNAVRKFAE